MAVFTSAVVHLSLPRKPAAFTDLAVWGPCLIPDACIAFCLNVKITQATQWTSAEMLIIIGMAKGSAMAVFSAVVIHISLLWGPSAIIDLAMWRPCIIPDACITVCLIQGTSAGPFIIICVAKDVALVALSVVVVHLPLI